jgi:hypothetical protein
VSTPPGAQSAQGGQSGPYGPQTLQIRRFLQRLAAMSGAEWEAVAAEFEALRVTPGFRRADAALGQVIERAGRESARDAALGPLLQLVRLPDAAPPGSAADDEDAAVPLAPVAEAALAAVLALLVRDLVAATAFATLYGPFGARIPLAALDG